MEYSVEEIGQLIAQAKKSDQRAFNLLVDAYWNMVYGFQLNRTKNENDAEDISIQTFAKAFDKLETYNSSFSFSTWLLAISKNIHLDLLRKKEREIISQPTHENAEEYYSIPDEAPGPEDIIIREQNLEKLLKHIKQLKPHYQEVIQLRYFQELPYKSIASKLGEPMSNIKVKLLRAKKLLAESLKENP